MRVGGPSATPVRIVVLLFLLTALLLGSFSVTSAQPDDAALTLTAGEYKLDVLRAWKAARAGDVEPVRDWFLVLETRLHNNGAEEHCFSAGDFLAQVGDVELEPGDSRAVQEAYYPGAGYPDSSSEQCVAEGSSAPGLLVFDVPTDLGGFTLFFTPDEAASTIAINFDSSDAVDDSLPASLDSAGPEQHTLRLLPLASAWYMTGAQMANIRACPAVTCMVLGTVRYGDVLAVSSTVNGWHAIQLAEGQVGYIAAYLTRRSMATEEWYVTGARQVNIRACGAVDCAVVGTLAYGDRIAVASTEVGWHEIQFPDGRTGYVAAHLTARTMPTEDLPSLE